MSLILSQNGTWTRTGDTGITPGSAAGVTAINSISEIPAGANGVYRLPSGEILSYVNGLGSPISGLLRTQPVLVATFGDSTANIGGASVANKVTASQSDYKKFKAVSWQSGLIQFQCPVKYKMLLQAYYPQAYIMFDGGISGETSTQMLARDISGTQIIKDHSLTYLVQAAPDVVLFRGGSINDLTPSGASASQAAMDAVIATSYRNHVDIITRLTSQGIYVIDSGIYGYSGTSDVGANPSMVRAALVKLNNMFQAYASTNPFVTFISPTGLVSDGNGMFYGNYVDSTGKHLMPYAQKIYAKVEANVLSTIFGISKNVRYPGTNIVADPLFAIYADTGTGRLASNITMAQTNTTFVNSIESINDKIYQFSTITSNNATYDITFNLPFNPTTMGIVSGDIFGFEFDLYIKPLTGSNITSTTTRARVDVRDTVGSGRILVEGHIADATWFDIIDSETIQHITFNPIVVDDVSANLTTASIWTFYIVFSGNVGDVVKVGVGNPRIIKLNQPVLTI